MPRSRLPHATALALAVAIGGLALQPVRSAAQGQPMTMHQVHTQIIDVGGTKTAYREIGSGRPIVLMQRFRGGMDDWDPTLVDALAKTRRVILFDSLGVGETAGATPPALEAQADFAADFIKTHRLGRVDVLGWSMGGMSAQILAIKHPELVDHLILTGTLPPGGDPQIVPSSPEWSTVAGKPVYTRDDLAYLFFTPTDVGKTAAKASLDRTGARRPATDMKVSQEAMGAQYAAILSFYKNEGGWFGRLKEIKARTLVANGDRDGAFPAIDSVILAREIPQAQLVIYPDAGHAFHFQYPERFAADVAAFAAR